MATKTVPQADAETDNRMLLCPKDIFEPCEEDTGVIVTAKGKARIDAALSAIETITSILKQRELDSIGGDGLSMTASTAEGLLQGIGICTEYITDLVNGGAPNAFYSQSVPFDTPAYALLKSTQEKLVVMSKKDRAAQGVPHA